MRTEFLVPILFVGSVFYPDGGWRDYRGFFNSMDEAQEYLENNCDPELEWAHLVEHNKITFQWFGKSEDGIRYTW